jgi:nitroreductase
MREIGVPFFRHGEWCRARMEDVPLDFVPRTDAELAARAAAFRRQAERRRTVRDFSDKPVPREVIADCLGAAASAPSGANQQPWHFAVIGDPGRKRRLREAAEAEERAFYAGRAPAEWREALAPLGTGPDKPFLETAPWLIAVFAQHTLVGPDGSSRPVYYPKESVGIACGFLLAALHDAGLATLTHTPSPMAFLNGLCGRPANEKPFLLVVVGHPAAGARVPAAARRKKPAAEIVSWL